jgi:hypothetical protein
MWKQLLKEMDRTSLYTIAPPVRPGATMIDLGTEMGSIEVEPHQAIKKDHMLFVEE